MKISQNVAFDSAIVKFCQLELEISLHVCNQKHFGLGLPLLRDVVQQLPHHGFQN